MQKWLAHTAIVLLLVAIPSRGIAQEPSSQPVFTAIQMFNAYDGWGGVEIPTTQSQNGINDDVLRTHDGGKTWTKVTPAGSAGSAYGQFGVFFLDALHAWFFSDNKLWRTSNGGRTWASVEVSFTLSFDTPPVHSGLLDFIDPLHGWVLASHSAAMGHHPEALDQTTNAGISWQDINDAYGPVGGLPDEAGVSSMVFEDTTTGWMTLDYEFGMGSGLLFYTQDGGATWTDVADNLPHSSDAAHICSYDQLRLFKPGSLTFIASCTDRDEKTAAAYVYHTEDDGKTWQMMSANPQWVGAITKPFDAFYLSGSPDIQMFSAMAGWMVALDNRVYKTLDGGQTWTEVAPLPAALISIPAGEDTPTPPINPIFDFVDAKTGWVIDVHGGLNVTRDGGQTWTLLKPVITPS